MLLAICGGLLALTQWLAPLTVVAIAFLLVCVAAHVAGNVLGSRLQQQPTDAAAVREAVEQSKARLRDADFAPPTRLRESQSLGWPLFVATMVGLVGGGALGGFWVVLSSPREPAELNIAVGVVACSILGGIFSFVAIGFLQVGGSAIWQTLQMGTRRSDRQGNVVADASRQRQ